MRVKGAPRAAVRLRSSVNAAVHGPTSGRRPGFAPSHRQSATTSHQLRTNPRTSGRPAAIATYGRSRARHLAPARSHRRGRGDLLHRRGSAATGGRVRRPGRAMAAAGPRRGGALVLLLPRRAVRPRRAPRRRSRRALRDPGPLRVRGNRGACRAGRRSGPGRERALRGSPRELPAARARGGPRGRRDTCRRVDRHRRRGSPRTALRRPPRGRPVRLRGSAAHARAARSTASADAGRRPSSAAEARAGRRPSSAAEAGAGRRPSSAAEAGAGRRPSPTAKACAAIGATSPCSPPACAGGPDRALAGLGRAQLCCWPARQDPGPSSCAGGATGRRPPGRL